MAIRGLFSHNLLSALEFLIESHQLPVGGLFNYNLKTLVEVASEISTNWQLMGLRRQAKPSFVCRLLLKQRPTGSWWYFVTCQTDTFCQNTTVE